MKKKIIKNKLTENFIINNYLKKLNLKKEGTFNFENDAGYLKLKKNKKLVITSDSISENIDFFKKDNPRSIAQKITTINLSDLSAMGVNPYAYSLNLFLPNYINHNWLNEFTKELALGNELLVFGEQFWRPYCHVYDLSLSVVKVFETDSDIADFNVYNVGNTSENYQKKMIVDEIIKQLPNSKIKYVEKNEDPRDYRVSFKKINDELGFVTTFTVPDGIKQTIKAINDRFILDPDDPKYKNI